MAENEGCRVTVEAFIVCTSPDVCWTQVGDKKVLIPYQIYAKFTDVVADVPTVRFAGENSINMETRITTVYGDEQGVHGGEKSGVNMGWCRPITHSTTIRVNGSFLIYHTSTYWMNCNGPDGPGNTKGEVQFFAAGTTPFGGPLVDLEKMRDDAEKSWWEKASPWVHGALDIVGLIPGLGEIADGVNGVIYLAEGNYVDAGLSFGAMIPFAGWGATAAKVFRKADNAIDTAKTVDKATDAVDTTRKLADEVPTPKPKDADGPPTKPKDGEGTAPGDGAKITKPAKGPARRHDPCKTKGNDPTKDKNSVVDPDVDVAADMDAINNGNFTRDGQDYVVNGRTYGIHPETGTTFPKSGPGITSLDRGQHQFLKKLNGKSFEDALKFAENFPGLDQSKIDAVLNVWRKCGK